MRSPSPSFPPPSSSPLARGKTKRNPPRRRRWIGLGLGFNATALLLAACIALCAMWSIRIHGLLHRHHDDHVVAHNRADNDNVDLPIQMTFKSPAHHTRIRGGGAHHRRRNHTSSATESITYDKNDGSGIKDDVGNNADNNNQKKGLSACLLVNDENPRLPEWLAYHYQILPLRSLIVAVDPGSRSSPGEILDRWTSPEMNTGLDIRVWEEEDYLPYVDSHGKIGRGACDAGDPKASKNGGRKGESDCLWRHRKRQRYFIKKCMADFKLRNMTWTLLIDVDEYIVFNRVQGDDPALPLDVAPLGMPTLADWRSKVSGFIMDPKTRQRVQSIQVEGTLTGVPEEGFRGKKNGDFKRTCDLVTDNKKDFFQGVHGAAYGNVVKDDCGAEYYLRDDFAFRDAVPMASAPGGVPTLRDSHVDGTILVGTIYNGTYLGKEDGERIEIKTNWREPLSGGLKTLMGGHLMNSADRRSFYVERDRELWPPHLSPEDLMSVRKRLPLVGNGKTVLDVLESETKFFGDYAEETIGPCLSMPRLLYGSREDQGRPKMAPDGFADADFVTLRYRWHAIKEAHANKFQKTIVDVSRLRMSNLVGEAENIHVPLKYYCRKDPPRYSASYFRVNHYLDSFEAYSYRNDARSEKRQCRECYDEKGKEAAHAMDDDIRPWLRSFVDSVGRKKAEVLLAGAGNFLPLS